LKIKKKKVQFGDIEIEIIENQPEYQNQVMIYELYGRHVRTITGGKTLREACNNWLDMSEPEDYVFGNLVANVKHWAKDTGIDMGSNCYVVLLSKFLESLTDEEFFAIMSFDRYHVYIDWNKVPYEEIQY